MCFLKVSDKVHTSPVRKKELYLFSPLKEIVWLCIGSLQYILQIKPAESQLYLLVLNWVSALWEKAVLLDFQVQFEKTDELLHAVFKQPSLFRAVKMASGLARWNPT